jgi:hypothetical protein
MEATCTILPNLEVVKFVADEELEESKVGQFGGFFSVQKLPYYLLTELRGFSCYTYVDLRILSHNASNFLINQTRKIFAKIISVISISGQV